MLQETNRLYDELAVVVNQIGEKEVLNSGLLSSTTLWRWKSKVNSKAPSGELVLELLRKASNLHSLHEVADYYGGEIKAFLQSSFAATFQYEQDNIIDKNASLLEDEYDFHIYFMCCNERGSTQDEIIHSLGRVAAKKANLKEEQLDSALIFSMGAFARPKIERLLGLNVIEQEDNYLKCKDTETYISERQAIKHSIDMFSNLINPSSWNEGKNIFYLSAEAVEPTVAKKATMVLKEAFLEVMELVNKNKSNSETATPFVFCVGGESLIGKPIESNQKELQQ